MQKKAPENRRELTPQEMLNELIRLRYISPPPDTSESPWFTMPSVYRNVPTIITDHTTPYTIDDKAT